MVLEQRNLDLDAVFVCQSSGNILENRMLEKFINELHVHVNFSEGCLKAAIFRNTENIRHAHGVGRPENDNPLIAPSERFEPAERSLSGILISRMRLDERDDILNFLRLRCLVNFGELSYQPGVVGRIPFPVKSGLEVFSRLGQTGKNT